MPLVNHRPETCATPKLRQREYRSPHVENDLPLKLRRVSQLAVVQAGHAAVTRLPLSDNKPLPFPRVALSD